MRTVALYGFSPLTRHHIYSSTADEVWTINTAYDHDVPMERVTRWYELHQEWQITDTHTAAERQKFLRQKHPFPVYMQKQDDKYPSSVEYPLDELLNVLPSRYLTSSISYLIAHAIAEGVDRLELYGCDLVQGTEYAYQKAGTEYLLGLAQGRGIDVYLPPGCELLNAPLYGYDGFTEMVHVDKVQEHINYYREYFATMRLEYDKLNRRFDAGEKEVLPQLLDMNPILQTYDGAQAYLQTMLNALEGQPAVSRQMLEREKARLLEVVSSRQGAMMYAAGYVTAQQELGKPVDDKIAEHEQFSQELHNNGGAVQAVNKLIKEIDLHTYDLELKSTVKEVEK